MLTSVSALSLPDKKPSQLKPDSEEGEEIFDSGNGLGIPGVLDEEKDCSCKKDDRLEKEKKQREKEIQFQINFEDALHNQVYVKRFVRHFLTRLWNDSNCCYSIARQNNLLVVS